MKNNAAHIPRIFQSEPFAVGVEFALNEAVRHHLLHVLRMKVKDSIIVFNGLGGEYHAEIAVINKKQLIVTLLSFSDQQLESPLKITLAQSLIRFEKMDFIIQKAVEMGVQQIVPLITAHTQIAAKLALKKRDHWQKVIISACEQSGRTMIPALSSLTHWQDWLSSSQEDRKFILHPYSSPQVHQSSDTCHDSVSLTIGPEGGFSAEEVAQANAQHFEALQLGPRILRAETAPIAAIALMQSWYGDYPQMSKKH